MSSYRRAKKEDATKPSQKELSIKIGSVKDDFKALQTICNDKAIELMKTVELDNGEEMRVAFWTEDFCELIGQAIISKSSAGQMSFTMDYSCRTL